MLPEIIKVSELNFLTKKILEGNFPKIFVSGEISNLVAPASGHLYFSLKDETAQVRAVIFRPHLAAIKFKPQNGIKVVVQASCSLYEPRGEYQLIVENLESSGLGLLHSNFLRLKEKLLKEGLFDQQYKKSLPQIPQTVGLITSATGAVINDLIKVLKRRTPKINIIIYPTLVQGELAPAMIIKALTQAEKRKECEVLILARGGGTIEDLWAFNDEKLARTIFSSTIPIISAIGHETDFTIADLVADARASTPSVAAEIVTTKILEATQELSYLKKRLSVLLLDQIASKKLYLAQLLRKLHHPCYYLVDKKSQLTEYSYRLKTIINRYLTINRERLIKVNTTLTALNPVAVLNRGYAIAINKNNQLITTINQVKIGDVIKIRLKNGRLAGLIKDIEPLAE